MLGLAVEAFLLIFLSFELFVEETELIEVEGFCLKFFNFVVEFSVEFCEGLVSGKDAMCHAFESAENGIFAELDLVSYRGDLWCGILVSEEKFLFFFT